MDCQGKNLPEKVNKYHSPANYENLMKERVNQAVWDFLSQSVRPQDL